MSSNKNKNSSLTCGDNKIKDDASFTQAAEQINKFHNGKEQDTFFSQGKKAIKPATEENEALPYCCIL